MKKIICLLLLTPLLAFAQFDVSMFRTDNQRLIEQAVADAFCIVEQAYQLEDTLTHQRFGRYGNENFGKSRTLGIRLGTNVAFNNNALSPWERDDNFQRYRATHRPVLSRLEIKNFNDSTYDQSYNITSDSILISNVSSMYSMVNDSVTGRIGFFSRQSNKEESGWFVWLIGDSIQSIQFNNPPSLSIYTKSVDFSNTDEPIIVDAPQVDRSILGGVFIIPEQAKIGQLDFYVYGILTKVEDDKWILETLNEFNGSTNPPVPVDELTPLNEEDTKKKKNKKKK